MVIATASQHGGGGARNRSSSSQQQRQPPYGGGGGSGGIYRTGRVVVLLIGVAVAVLLFVLTTMSMSESFDGMRSVVDPTLAADQHNIATTFDLQGLWRNHYNEATHARRDLDGGGRYRLPNRCLDATPGGAMDQILADHKMVYFLMPALGAGSTVKHFVSQCMAGKRSFSDGEDNILNKWHEGKDLSLKEALTDSLEVQTLLVSHAYTDETLVDLMKHATRNSLIVYVHREETDRIKASVRHVVERMCPPEPEQCKLKENDVVEAISKQGTEMTIGMSQILTCNTYEAIGENRPNLIFLDVKQLDALFPLVAKHHCPHRAELETISMNTHRQRRIIFVELNKGIHSGGSSIYFLDLADWVEHKGEILEYVMDFKKDVTCQATTRNLEDDFVQCPSRALLLSGGTRGGGSGVGWQLRGEGGGEPTPMF